MESLFTYDPILNLISIYTQIYFAILANHNLLFLILSRTNNIVIFGKIIEKESKNIIPGVTFIRGKGEMSF